MKFGETPLGDAAGAILAHGLSVNGKRLKKGRVLSDADIESLRGTGVKTVVVARPEAGDIGEDDAAGRVAGAAAGDHLSASAPFTGRVNLFAGAHGLAVYDPALLDRLNRIDEAITIAALPACHAVEARQMVATIKIIPFAVPETALDAVISAIRQAGGLFRVAPFKQHKIGLVQTELPGTRAQVLDKTVEVLRHRIEGVGSQLAGDTRCAHRVEEVSAAIDGWLSAGCDMILVSGASAITDRRDIVPAAI
ncbi:MAG: 4-diphosphocytidyl-2C-methyl-D-erythritol kinase, partial [Alphaproteobacteria bacterium]